MTHEASLRRSFMTNRYREVPNFPRCQGPRMGNFFETPCTYTIVERCGNFIYDRIYAKLKVFDGWRV